MHKRLLLVWFAAVVTLGGAPPAFAQDEPAPADDSTSDDETGGDDDTLDAIEAATDEAPPAAAAPAAAPAASEAADDGDKGERQDDLDGLSPGDKLYWATVRNIYTMQQRRFRKSHRFGVTVYGGLIPNNIFERYIPAGVRLNYFILENIGIELAASYNLKLKTGLEDRIREEGGVAAGQVLIGDTQVAHSNFGLVWSPFYGKAAFYNSGLLHFDLFLFAGVGAVVKETTPDFNADAEQEIKPEGALGAGLAFFLSDHFVGRFDFRQFVFEKVVGGVANPSEVSFGLSFFF